MITMVDKMAQAENYLLQIPMWTRKKNSLDTVREFLHRMGDPDESMKLIHVAGTNGKGSVCAYITSILRETGYHVGTFISPHLTDVRERFLVDGQMAGEDVFAAAFEKVHAVAQEMVREGHCHPTYFEFLFLMAMELFAGCKLDYVILETGLGGRLDTTNVIRHPIVTVITSISLDHVQYLGDTISQIAAEKAGIIKPGVPVVYDDTQPEASEVILRRAEKLESTAYAAGEALPGIETTRGIGTPPEPDGFTAEGTGNGVVFAAPYQRRNAALAVRALEVSGIPGITGDAIRRGLRKTVWEGRMEHVAPGVWMDGAHNVGGIRAFVEAVLAMQAQKRTGIRILFAAVADKDYSQMIRLLADGLHPERVYVVQMDSERAASLPELLQICRQHFGCTVTGYEDEKEALETAMEERAENTRLFIVGSLYLIGEMKKILRRK